LEQEKGQRKKRKSRRDEKADQFDELTRRRLEKERLLGEESDGHMREMQEGMSERHDKLGKAFEELLQDEMAEESLDREDEEATEDSDADT